MLKRVMGMACGGALLFMAVNEASAFEQQGVAAGNTEASIFGDFSSSSAATGPSTTSLIVGGSYGYFVTDPLELGGALTGVASGSGGSTTGVMSFTGFTKYHFLGNPTMIPYVGLNAGSTQTTTAGQSTSNFTYGATGGAKFFMSEYTAMGLEGYYRSQTTQGGGSLNTLGVNVSVNFYM